MLQSLLRMVIFHSSASLLEDTSFPISHPALQVTVNWDSPTLSHRAAVKYQRFASNAGKEIAQATWKGEKPIGKRSHSHPNLSKCPGVWKMMKAKSYPIIVYVHSTYVIQLYPIVLSTQMPKLPMEKSKTPFVKRRTHFWLRPGNFRADVILTYGKYV